MILKAKTLSSAVLAPSTPIARRGSTDTGAPVRLGHPGRCPHKPTLLSILFDNSGSVGGAGGNDPIGNRFAEARLAIETVQAACRCKRELVAVFHFDTPTRGDLPPTPLSKTSPALLGKALRVPHDGAGSSCLRPSLDRALDLMHTQPDHQHTLCVLSDFELLDSNLPTLYDALETFPGTVHAVVMRAEPPQALLDASNVLVTRIGYGDPPGALATAVYGALRAHRRAR